MGKMSADLYLSVCTVLYYLSEDAPLQKIYRYYCKLLNLLAKYSVLDSIATHTLLGLRVGSAEYIQWLVRIYFQYRET